MADSGTKDDELKLRQFLSQGNVLEWSDQVVAIKDTRISAKSESNQGSDSCSISLFNFSNNFSEVVAIKFLFLTSVKQLVAKIRLLSSSFRIRFVSSKNLLLSTLCPKRKLIISATNFGSIIPQINRKTSCQLSSCQCAPKTSSINRSIVKVCDSLNCQTNSQAQKYSKKVRCTKP